MQPLIVIVVLLVLLLTSAIKVFREYERGVIFRLGRLVDYKGPGIFFIIPIIDRVVKVSLRVVTLDVPTQDIITKDNVSIKVNAVIFYRVVEPSKAIVEVEDYLYATSQLAQTTLRSILGQAELDELLAERDKINQELQKVIDKHTDPWGIKVVSVEVKHVDLPPDMQRAMAKQAEAERERRAKVIHALGEFEASETLAKAANVISKHPQALQLRYLQTLSEVASENNSTTIFPVPIDLIGPFLEGKLKKDK
ncbi:MAG TPA: slipin family protein [bacterium]|nr:slipin family protein [bacterium]HPN43263.1 slipin family protein [bacterium]